MNKAATPACVFVGPSLAARPPPAGIDVMPPATRGAVTAALAAGYNRIGIIDGAIDDDVCVPLRELEGALAVPDVELIGGASVGAISAVQLRAAGMRGVGRVFRLFCRGSLSDAEEVHVLHAPAALRYRCLTLPLVNIRYTLRAITQSWQLDPAEERAIVDYMCTVPWFDRDRQSLSAAVYATSGTSRSQRLIQTFESAYRDVKHEDAMAVISALLRSRCPGAETGRTAFESEPFLMSRRPK